MNQADQRVAPTIELSSPAGTLASPRLPVADERRVRLGSQAPMLLPDDIADAGDFRLGAQAPMFLPEAIADAGLVRLGGRNPAF